MLGDLTERLLITLTENVTLLAFTKQIYTILIHWAVIYFVDFIRDSLVVFIFYNDISTTMLSSSDIEQRDYKQHLHTRAFFLTSLL